MDSVTEIGDRLEQAFRGSPFHSFLNSLRGLTDEEARWAPAAYRGFTHMDGSILNLVFHTGGDKHVLISHAFGDGSVTWETVERQFERSGSDIRAATALAEEGHRIVLAALHSVGETGLTVAHPYYGGKMMSARAIFSIIAEHDLYHAGQIRYVRNLIAGGIRDIETSTNST